MSRLSPGKRVRLQFAVSHQDQEPAVDVHEVIYDRRRVERTKRVVEYVWRAIEGEHFYPHRHPCNARAARSATLVGRGKANMAAQDRTTLHDQAAVLEVSGVVRSAAIIASPTVGHLGVAVVIWCLYLIRRTWLKRPLPAREHFSHESRVELTRGRELVCTSQLAVALQIRHDEPRLTQVLIQMLFAPSGMDGARAFC